MPKRALSISLILLVLLFSGCSSNSTKAKVSEEYISALAGKTFQAKAGQTITFYADGLATYDYQNGVGENHHYCYIVTVVESSDVKIDMTLETIWSDSEVFHNEDYIDIDPELATYSFSDNTLRYYQTYSCVLDPSDATFFSNTYGDFHTICAEEGCRMYIAPSGHTKYCTEHTSACEHCENFVDPGNRFCVDCPYCIECFVKIPPDTGLFCSACAQDNKFSNQGVPSNGKCYWCNGTGKVKYYYGSSDLEAYFNGHDPYWYGQCGSCGGSGKS